MSRRIPTLAAALFGAVTLFACAEQPDAPTGVAPGSVAEARDARPFNKTRAALLTNLAVSGALSDGGTFLGTFTATRLDVDETTRALTVTGTLSGTATKATGEVVAVPATVVSAVSTLEREGAAPGLVQPVAMAVCDVLFLDLGPLNLDLLGLTVDLSQIVLDINAVSGAGNLLGNLLCGLVSILDLPGIFATIASILDRINDILDGLSDLGVGGASFQVDVQTPGGYQIRT